MEQRPQYREGTRAGDEWRQVQQINKLKAEKEEYQRQIAELEAKQQQARLDIAISHGTQDISDRQKRRRKEEEQRKQEERNRKKRETPAYQNTPTEKILDSDERQLIGQYLELQADRERGRPRSTGKVSQKTSERGDADIDQKVENLKAAMEEFNAAQESAQRPKWEKQPKPPPPEQEQRRNLKPKR